MGDQTATPRLLTSAKSRRLYVMIASAPAAKWKSARRQGLVRRALARLSSTNREMILLKEIQGMSLEEIASILRIPLGTVKSRSSRARLELAHEILAIDRREGVMRGE